jgi:hypothetical protein
VGYFFGNTFVQTKSGGGGGNAGKYLSAPLAAGATNDFNPGSGWPTGYGRLDLVPGGAATLNSLVGGADGQEVIVRNASTTQTITIPVAGGGSAANEFTGGGGGTILPPLTAKLIVYYAGTINNWVLV